MMVDGLPVEDLVFFPVCGFLFFGDAFEGAAGVEAFEEAADAVDVEVTGAAHGTAAYDLVHSRPAGGIEVFVPELG